jgi:predicted dehydrogenase
MELNRRNFVKKAALAGLGTAAISGGAIANPTGGEKQQKKPVTSANDKIRLGFIGVGARGGNHLINTLNTGKADVVAICDISDRSITRAKETLSKSNISAAKLYTGSEFAYEDMLEKEHLDAVLIATPWEWHTRMAVAAMKSGAYTGVEVPCCTTLEEGWDLVNVHEETGIGLMFLENVNYSRNFLAVLNMVRQGIFGELLHCRCGYMHDLRGAAKFNDGITSEYKPGTPLKYGKDAISEAQWRGLHSLRRNGDLYPTHGLGPVAVLLDINNGNRFLSITSSATKARGLQKYVNDYGGPNHPLRNVQWNCGDIVTSTIKCANGETVIVTHNCNNPRPYSRDFIVQGTNGIWQAEWKSIYIENQSPVEDQYQADASWLTKYDHKYWIQEGEKASGSGHGGVDYFELIEFFDAVKNKKPAPINVYDGVTWSVVSALSEMSIARGNNSVDFPDFTRGQWIKFKQEKVFALDEKFPIIPERYASW